MTEAQQYLQERLFYDPATGLWIWIKAPKHNADMLGKLAGHRRPDGRLKIRVDTFAFYASHLANLYMTGELPNDEMDHIDHDPSNDIWENLREATSSQNKWNRRAFGRDGYKGVYRAGAKWQVIVGNQYRGLFTSLQDALVFRDNAAYELAGEFAFLNLQRNAS